MTILELGALGDFVGSFAVIVSLLYLARQIKQNTESTKAIGYQTWQTISTNTWLSLAESPHLGEHYLRSVSDSRLLTDVSALQVGSFMLNNFRQYQMTYWLYEKKVIDHDLFMVEMHMAAANLQIPMVQQWWSAGGRNQMTSAFAEFVEKLEPAPNANWAWTPETGYVGLEELLARTQPELAGDSDGRALNEGS